MKPITSRPLDWIDRAPVRLSATRRIQAPVADVWGRVADHESWPEWWSGLQQVEPGARATGVGGTRRVHLAGKVTIEEEFLAWEEQRRFAFAVTHMKPRMLRSLVEDVVLDPVEDGVTDVTYTQGWDPKGGRLVQAVIRRTVGPQISDALDELAKLLGG